MTVPVTQTFLPGPRLIDGSDLNNLKDQTNAGFALVGLQSAQVNTAITTVGAGTLTAASIVGGVITRSGSTAAYTDTTDTAAAIIAAVPGYVVGQTWSLTIDNTVAFAETLAGGTGVTLAGNTIIPPLCWGRFLVTITSSTAVSVRMVESGQLNPLPVSAFTADTAQATTIQVAGLVAAQIATVSLTGATPGALAIGPAADIVAAMPNARIGQTWQIVIKNNAATTAQLTGIGGVAMTVAQVNGLTAATFNAKIDGLTTVQLSGISRATIQAT